MQTHPNYELAKAYVQSLGYVVVEDQPRFDITDGKTYAMVKVEFNKDLYKGSQFSYGNQNFFVDWAREVYRKNNPHKIKFRRSEQGPIFEGNLIRIDGASAKIDYIDGFGQKTSGWFLADLIIS